MRGIGELWAIIGDFYILFINIAETAPSLGTFIFEVYDLLDTASVRRKLTLRQSKEGGVQIPDLTCRPVASDEDISNVPATLATRDAQG